MMALKGRRGHSGLPPRAPFAQRSRKPGLHSVTNDHPSSKELTIERSGERGLSRSIEVRRKREVLILDGWPR